MKSIPGIIGAIVEAALMATPAAMSGKRLARDQAAIDSSKGALERIQSLKKNDANFSKLRLAIVASCSCVIAACETAPATDGAGYQLVRFTDAARPGRCTRTWPSGRRSIPTTNSAGEIPAAERASQTPQTPHDTREWLATLREGKLETLKALVYLPEDDVRDGSKLVRELGTVGRWMRLLILTVVTIFVATVMLYQNTHKVLGCFKGGPTHSSRARRFILDSRPR